MPLDFICLAACRDSPQSAFRVRAVACGSGYWIEAAYRLSQVPFCRRQCGARIVVADSNCLPDRSARMMRKKYGLPDVNTQTRETFGLLLRPRCLKNPASS